MAPTYPQSALERGVEGWVAVEFTITESGSVADPVIVASHPNPIFNAEALRAVERWKYEPMRVDGNAVALPGIRARLVFELRRD